VLVLNNYYLAVHVCTAREAILLLTSHRAEVIDEDYRRYSFDEWANYTIAHPELHNYYCGIVHSPSVNIYVPYVIKLLEFDTSIPENTTIRYSRHNIYERDHNTCQYCGFKGNGKNLTVDHVIPRCKGGTSTWTNVVVACKRCNGLKGSKSLEELGWKLSHPPKQPKWKSFTGTPFYKTKKQVWEKFLR